MTDRIPHRWSKYLPAYRPVLFGVLLVAAAALAACSPETPAMRQAVDDFHSAYNLGQFAKIYYELMERPDDPRVNFQQAQGLLQYAYDKYGMAQDTKLVDSFQKDFFTDDTYLKLTYRTTFSRGTFDEEFTFHVMKDHATLVKWYVTGLGSK